MFTENDVPINKDLDIFIWNDNNNNNNSKNTNNDNNNNDYNDDNNNIYSMYIIAKQGKTQSKGTKDKTYGKFQNWVSHGPLSFPVIKLW